MIIGIPKEIKNNENRVALPPSGVFDLTNRGHQVLVEKDAGKGSAITDEEYVAAGATIIDSAADVWAAEMVMKVKEPLPEEYQYFRKGLLLFTYLHLAANKPLTEALVNSGVNAIAYELSGVPGVRRGNVVVIGGGVVGLNAAKLALGLGANVTLLDVSVPRLKELDIIFGNSVQTMMSNSYNIQECLKTADLVIGAVLIPGHKAPTLVTKEMVAQMPDHGVIVDVAIDQGGIFETEDRVTTHDDPTYVTEGVVHYAVANMPGAVPQTATYALSNSTMAYANLLANNTLEEILKNNLALRRGVNTYNGKLTIEPVAKDLNMEYTSIDEVLNEELMMNS